MIQETGKWKKCVSTQGNLRGVAMEVTDLVRAMARAHKLSPRGAQGLGEVVLGALQFASYCKPGQRVNLNIQGDGRYAQALVEAFPDGRLRGYLIEREGKDGADIPEFGPWGTGLLSVLRTQLNPENKADQGNKQPYIGTVPLVTGHMAKDLSFYWTQSEQVPSAVGIFVESDETGGNLIKSAWGFLVQALPGATPQEIKLIEQHLREIHLGKANAALYASHEPMQVLAQLFQNAPFMVLEERDIHFSCDCSRERVERSLILIGSVELQALLDENQGASVSCDFCTKEYAVTSEELAVLIKTAKEREG